MHLFSRYKQNSQKKFVDGKGNQSQLKTLKLNQINLL